MKVAYVISRADTLGGAHIHVADMAEWLRRNGHDAWVITGGRGPYCLHLERKQIPYTSSAFLRREINPLHDVRAVAELRTLLKKASPDVISLHSSKAGIVGRIAAARLRIPVVFTAHGWAFTEGVSKRRAAFYRRLERLTAGLAEYIITVSEYDKVLAENAGITARRGIVAIHNGMPDVPMRADAGQSTSPARIIMVARLDHQKDHRTLLHALAKLSDREWEVDLVGDGPLEGRIRSEAAELGLADRVNFLGLRGDVHDLLARSHLCVLSTHWEGFPRTILEAMRAGLPVIATAVGGIGEAVEPGTTGFLVGRNDAGALADRLLYLLDRPHERARMGGAGRARYEERFQFARMAGETVAVYETLLGSRACASV